MLKINSPNISAIDLFNSCINTVVNIDDRKRFENAGKEVAKADADYRTHFANLSLQSLPNTQSNILSVSEMISLYANQLVPSSKINRRYYDEIMSLAKNGLCPICSLGSVVNLDHYLPKVSHSIYAINPINLIPICRDCNFEKNCKTVNASEAHTLHPYLDIEIDFTWIKAELNESNDIAIRVFPLPPNNTDPVLKERLINHFKIFKLDKFYRTRLIDSLHNSLKKYKKAFQNHSSLLLSNLQDDYESAFEVNPNSSKTVLIKTLLDSTWFCSGAVLDLI